MGCGPGSRGFFCLQFGMATFYLSKWDREFSIFLSGVLGPSRALDANIWRCVLLYSILSVTNCFHTISEKQNLEISKHGDTFAPLRCLVLLYEATALLQLRPGRGWLHYLRVFHRGRLKADVCMFLVFGAWVGASKCNLITLRTGHVRRSFGLATGKLQNGGGRCRCFFTYVMLRTWYCHGIFGGGGSVRSAFELCL